MEARTTARSMERAKCMAMTGQSEAVRHLIAAKVKPPQVAVSVRQIASGHGPEDRVLTSVSPPESDEVTITARKSPAGASARHMTPRKSISLPIDSRDTAMRIVPRKYGPETLIPPERVSPMTSSGNQRRIRFRHGAGRLKPTSRHQPNAEIVATAKMAASAKYSVSALFMEDIACSNSVGRRICSGESSPTSPTMVSGNGSRLTNIKPSNRNARPSEKSSGQRSANSFNKRVFHEKSGHEPQFTGKIDDCFESRKFDMIRVVAVNELVELSRWMRNLGIRSGSGMRPRPGLPEVVTLLAVENPCPVGRRRGI